MSSSPIRSPRSSNNQSSIQHGILPRSPQQQQGGGSRRRFFPSLMRGLGGSSTGSSTGSLVVSGGNLQQSNSNDDDSNHNNNVNDNGSPVDQQPFDSRATAVPNQSTGTMNNSSNVMNASQQSLDTSNVFDLPPPETTRPPPTTLPEVSQRSNRRRGWGSTRSLSSSIKGTASFSSTRSLQQQQQQQQQQQPLQPSHSRPSLQSIMAEQVEEKRLTEEQEQKRQQQQAEEAEQQQREAELFAEQMQEEEFVRLAMELSLTESMNRSQNIFNCQGAEEHTNNNSANQIVIDAQEQQPQCPRRAYSSDRMNSCPNLVPVAEEAGSEDEDKRRHLRLYRRYKSTTSCSTSSSSNDSLGDMFKDDRRSPVPLRGGKRLAPALGSVHSNTDALSIPSHIDVIDIHNHMMDDDDDDMTQRTLQLEQQYDSYNAGGENLSDRDVDQSALLSSIATSIEGRRSIKIDGRQVVLEMARRFLDPTEVRLIENTVLRKGGSSTENERAHVKELEEEVNRCRQQEKRVDSKSSFYPTLSSYLTEEDLKMTESVDNDSCSDKEEREGCFVHAFVKAASSANQKLTDRDEVNLKFAASHLTCIELFELNRNLRISSSPQGKSSIMQTQMNSNNSNSSGNNSNKNKSRTYMPFSGIAMKSEAAHFEPTSTEFIGHSAASQNLSKVAVHEMQQETSVGTQSSCTGSRTPQKSRAGSTNSSFDSIHHAVERAADKLHATQQGAAESLANSNVTTSRVLHAAVSDAQEPHITEDELRAIQKALGEDDMVLNSNAASHNNDGHDHHAPLSAEESAAIMKALREADEMEERKSLELALKILEDSAGALVPGTKSTNVRRDQGNVRVMTREEYRREQIQHVSERTSLAGLHRSREEDYPGVDDEQVGQAGYRMNTQSNVGGAWRRRDHNSVVGPDNEVRTKHDETLTGLANVQRLGLDSDDFPVVGNKAYNSFMQSVKKSTKKGVETQGTGRAGSDADGIKGGAMDPSVRSQISKAINHEIIERCNGIVKEGKEAVVYHADKGNQSDGFDVAIKVFKRIKEFRGRADYVDGDPRYSRNAFRNNGSREQLELWAEKEYRNLVRANRAGVPVPTPILHKDNILFMRFLGTDGWPAPQLRELELRHGSRRWETLYWQIIEAVKCLYQCARLVHGDLSEYNVLVVPSDIVENRAVAAIDSDEEELQTVLIDFGQAVDTRHPNAQEYLERDLDRILSFFSRQGVITMSKADAVTFVQTEIAVNKDIYDE